MNRETFDMLSRLTAIGISRDDAFALRRIAMTLHRWHELECGYGNDFASWAIERDDDGDGKPYLCTYPHRGAPSRRRIPDREAGARKRLAAIMARYPTLAAYVQPDPRGAALYILRLGDVPDGQDVAAWYYNRGIAVYR